LVLHLSETFVDEVNDETQALLAGQTAPLDSVSSMHKQTLFASFREEPSRLPQTVFLVHRSGFVVPLELSHQLSASQYGSEVVVPQ
jgi:hypothetical protein